MQRVVGARDKALLTFDLGYTPAGQLHEARAGAGGHSRRRRRRRHRAAASAGKREAAADCAAEDDPLWMRIWRGDVVKIGITVAALGALTLIFFFQNALVRRPPSTLGFAAAICSSFWSGSAGMRMRSFPWSTS